MNNLQKVILAVGSLVLLGNLAFPPWTRHTLMRIAPDVYTVNSEGRYFIGNPPAGSESRSLPILTYRLDWSILVATSLAIVVGTGVAFGLTVLFKKPRSP